MRVLIKHSTGSKANRIEQFSIESSESISLGRDPVAMVTYDPEKDDLVSRRHALIRIKKNGELSFTIEDLQSRNGTFLNGGRLTGEQELLPGDVVEFGAGGPKFTFDIEPRLPHLIPRTKIRHGEEHPEAAPELVSTGGTAMGSAPKIGVGRSTVVDMLSEQFNRANRNWMYILAGVLALTVILGAGLYYQNITAERRMTDKFAATIKPPEAADKMTPEQIATAYRGSILLVESQWRLLDRQSGKQVFHKRIPKDGKLLPAYVKLKKDGHIVPWLVLDQDSDNQAIVQGISGSGFVVRDDGFILTNRHVATPWEYTMYFASDYTETDGLLFEEDHVEEPQRGDWTCEAASTLFDDKRPSRIARETEPVFQARSDKLEVRLPGNSVPLDARVIRVASKADIALVKTDPPDPMKPVPLAGPDYKPPLGGPVTVIGYPGVSSRTFEVAEWVEAGRVKSDVRELAQPTVVEGIISNIGRGIVRGEPNVALISTEGETYQLSIGVTGPGASGGPVIGSDGAAVAILTFEKTGTAGEKVFFATPIKASYEILKLK